MRIPPAFGLIMAVALACGEPALDDPATREPLPTHALAGLPMPPTAGAVSTRGTGNSIEITLVDTIPPASVADFYRASLIAQGWDLRSDTRLPDGGISLHALLGDRPVWVMIHPREPSGSRFSVIAGVRDTAAR